MDSKLSMLFEENDENAVLHTREAALQQNRATASIPGLLDHLVTQSRSVAKKVTGLSVELSPAQNQCIEWAIEREKTPRGIQMFHWVKLSDGAFFNPALGKFSKTKPADIRGGIIGDVQEPSLAILALVLNHPANSSDRSSSGLLAGAVVSDATLVIVSVERHLRYRKLILSGQCIADRVDHWMSQGKSNGIAMYHYDAMGSNSPQFLAEQAVVVVTYQTISLLNHPDDQSPFDRIRWWRVVCDDSHLMGKCSRPTVRSLLQLGCRNKWLVSGKHDGGSYMYSFDPMRLSLGTPIDTTLDDLANQLRFLGVDDVSQPVLGPTSL